MNPTAVLGLLGDLYAQMAELQRQLDEANKALAQRPPIAPEPKP